VAFFSIVPYLVVIIAFDVFFACWVLLGYVKLYGFYVLPIYCRFLIRLPGICLVLIVVLLKVSKGVTFFFYTLFIEPIVKFDG